jgi:hypothetical protein
MTKILLHACCAVCAGYPIDLLIEIGYEPIVYFFNPNIHPQEEYQRRLNELIRYTDKKNIKLIIEEENVQNWFDYVKGLEKEKEKGLRCHKCFEYRLNRASQKAKEIGIEEFTTTLFVSPHKIRKDIIEQGLKVEKKYGIKFQDIDFRKKDGFLKTMQIAKKENFYRQTYCGCIFSQNKEDKTN